MKQRSWILIVGFLATCAWAVACTDDGDGFGDDEPCVPGMSEACTCPDGAMGARVCEPDGLGFGECACEGSGETGDDDPTTGDGDPTTGDGDPGDGDPGDGDPGDGDPSGDGDGDDGWDGESIPSWSQHVVPFFYQSCGAGVNGCHSREAYAANEPEGCRGWLSLEDVALGSEIYAPPEMAGTPTGCPDMPLHDRLLTLAPWQCDPNSAYVDTADVDQSYILRKMRGVDLCATQEGLTDPMPPPSSGIEITQMDIDMIEAWIAAGAPSNN